jgi:hypothetical protein
MHYRRLVCFVALMGALLSTAATPQVVDFGRYPNFSGQWSRPAGNPNNWRQVAGPPPYTPEGEKKFADIQEIAKQGSPANWPSTFCIPTGMPAMMNLYNPMEIVITPTTTYILMSHNNDQIRRIYTDGRSWPDDGEYEPTYAGYSIGKWVDQDGDGRYGALEVETRFLKDVRAYDVNGYPFADDGKTVIKERFYLDKSDPNTLYDEITVIDSALTRPYTKLMKALRTANPHPIWFSEVCQEGNLWIKIGDEAYYISVDGKLMPSKKGQPPPDLKYFGRAK